MSITRDESRALGFIALLLALSAGARLLDRPHEVRMDAAVVDVEALEGASREAKAAAEEASRPLGPGERVDPNAATVEQLMRLPRVGRAVAERIVADRQANGPFRALTDLGRVRGIGPATLAQWEDKVALPAGAAPARAPPRGSPAVGGPAAGLIDVNRATAAELERVPGIGPALASRIVAYRDSAGGFTSLAALEKVRGIGPALLERIRPHLRR